MEHMRVAHRPNRLALRLKYILWILLLILTFAALSTLIGQHDPTALYWVTLAGWAFASAVFGAFVGFAELLSRYRDEPMKATVNLYGLTYLSFNALISLTAFAVLRQHAESIFPGLQENLFLTTMAAGFGGMALFRSKLFTLRSEEGEDYDVGPAIVLETILRTIDRKIDRLRASLRQQRVFDQMKTLTDFPRTAQYFQASLLSFQNLNQAEKALISEIISEYGDLPWPDVLKINAVGFAFLTIAGEENFDRVVSNLKEFLAAPAQPQSPGG